jgi:hypothetical protein
MKRHEKIELEIHRSGLLSSTARRVDIETACKALSRHVSRMDRLRLELCNGVPKEWDSARREWIMGLDDSDTARIESQWGESRDAVTRAARSILKRGLRFTWYRDPRGAAVVRIYNNSNTKDVFL